MKRTFMLLALCSFETMLVITFAAFAVLAQETAPSSAVANPPACQNNKGEQLYLKTRCRQKPNLLLA
tara:strand:- start:1492 stop:1692 length:201 start_codon:yes stop_codon:yes gene_type:complete